MAMGTSVFRIRIELIFRRCWNLITPCGYPQGPPPMSAGTNAGARKPWPRFRTQPQRGGLLGLHCGGDVVALGHVTINKLPKIIASAGIGHSSEGTP